MNSVSTFRGISYVRIWIILFVHKHFFLGVRFCFCSLGSGSRSNARVNSRLTCVVCKQRVAIARALLKDAPILILDEVSILIEMLLATTICVLLVKSSSGCAQNNYFLLLDGIGFSIQLVPWQPHFVALLSFLLC
jgi:hypothetical protein